MSEKQFLQEWIATTDNAINDWKKEVVKLEQELSDLGKKIYVLRSPQFKDDFKDEIELLDKTIKEKSSVLAITRSNILKYSSLKSYLEFQQTRE